MDPNTEIMKLNYYVDHPLKKKKKEKEYIERAITKTATNSKVERFTNDQLQDLVTKMRVWLIVLTCNHFFYCSHLFSDNSL